MGLDLTIYEVKNYDFNNYQTEFDTEEVLYLSNSTAMLLLSWLERNVNRELPSNTNNLCYNYNTLQGYKLKTILEHLQKVLFNENGIKRDTFALFYFPCLYTIGDWVSSVEMYSDEYYYHLSYLFEKVSDLLKKDNVPHPDERMFLYNISW